MNTLRIIIEKSADSYWAYAETIDGIYGAGDTLQEVKKSIDDAIATVKSFEKHEIPKALLQEHELKFVFDTQSFLEYYEKILSRASLSRLTGINKKQLGHYIQGLHKPRKDKVDKIERALHALGQELLSVELS